MVSSVIALALIAVSGQSDTTRSAREAYYRCLNQYVDSSVEARRALADFQSALAGQCAAEMTAYRAAVMQREGSTRATSASAERTATEAVEEMRETTVERFRFRVEPQ